MSKRTKVSRRQMLKLSAAAAGTGIAGSALAQVCADTVPIAITGDASPPPGALVSWTTCKLDADIYPASPFILNPFTQPMPVPTALAPGYRNPDGTLAAPGPTNWTVRQKNGVFGSFVSAPGPGPGNQDSIGDRPMFNDGKTYTFVNPKTGQLTTKTLNFGGARAGTHQLFPGGIGTSYANLTGQLTQNGAPNPQAKIAFDRLNTTPILYHIRLQVRPASVTTSPVVALNPAATNQGAAALPAGATATAAGNVTLPAGFANAGAIVPSFVLPKSTIYGFNGTFPGPMINIDYGRPVIVRFENDLDLNPQCLNRGDFGAPDWAFLTHLHNGHTAPESDGQPNHLQDNEGGYQPAQWVDNLYLGYGAGGLDEEKQSTLWFHDHRMHHTGPNVYKGMVGLMPHYDPATSFNPTGIDPGDETLGLRLPGVRTNNPDGTFNVKYDIYMAFYDCRMDDGVAGHLDVHQPTTAKAWSNNVCGNSHPEWWGKLFHQHYPNHGFVGDIFTVNGVAYPTLAVERRHYRFRFLDASVSRQYRLALCNTFGGITLLPMPGKQGQWSFQDNKGRQVNPPLAMRMVQIAAEGGLLQSPVLRDFIDIWPAKRREVVIDFSTYQDGTQTKAGDKIYLCNLFEMLDGRNVTAVNVPGGGVAGTGVVPMVQFVIASNQLTADASNPGLSSIPVGVKNQSNGEHFDPTVALRPRLTPPRPFNDVTVPEDMDFTLARGSAPAGNALGSETEWIINGLQFDPLNPLWAPQVNSFEVWGINNGGGGWTHPMHIHFEEHQVLYRSSGTLPFAGNATGNTPHLEDGPRTQIFQTMNGLNVNIGTCGLGKEDVVNLEGSEQTKMFRSFRTFLGNYVAHCHNLAHEDHNMMFGWSVTK